MRGLVRRPSLCWTMLLAAACGEPARLSTFDLGPPPDRVRAFPWVPLAQDAASDGRRDGRGDASSLSFHYDPVGDTLWFRFELFEGFDAEKPAVSVSLDTDVNQETGFDWYGANDGFRFDKLLSVGPLERVGTQVRGYNGITSAEGVRRQDWIDERAGVLTLYVDSLSMAYMLGVARADILPGLTRFNVIGSVGSDAAWNDDIGESGYALVELEGPAIDGGDR